MCQQSLYDFLKGGRGRICFCNWKNPSLAIGPSYRKRMEGFPFLLGFPKTFPNVQYIGIGLFSGPRSLVFWVCFETWQGPEDSSCRHRKHRWLSPLRRAAEDIKTAAAISQELHPSPRRLGQETAPVKNRHTFSRG